MPFFFHHNHRLFYRERGKGPLMLILPGNTASSACHEGELTAFSDRFHAVSLDFWGTGQSDRMADWPENWWILAAQDAAGLIQHLNEGPACVIGVSGGGWIALLLATLQPNLVRAVIVDSAVAPYPPEALRLEVNKRSQRTCDQVNFWQFAQGENWEQVIKADNRLLLALAEQGGDLFQGRLKEISCPVLLTLSLQGEINGVERIAAAMLEQIQNSRCVLLRDGGHPAIWTAPDEFRQYANCFLSQFE